MCGGEGGVWSMCQPPRLGGIKIIISTNSKGVILSVNLSFCVNIPTKICIDHSSGSTHQIINEVLLQVCDLFLFDKHFTWVSQYFVTFLLLFFCYVFLSINCISIHHQHVAIQQKKNKPLKCHKLCLYSLLSKVLFQNYMGLYTSSLHVKAQVVCAPAKCLAALALKFVIDLLIGELVKLIYFIQIVDMQQI